MTFNNMKKELNIYVVFHKCIYPEFYEDLSDFSKSLITFYGVHNTTSKTIGPNTNIIYEYNLPLYKPELQQRIYNEGSALWHIYMNQLFCDSAYIGLFQYDMRLKEETIKHIISTIREHEIIHITDSHLIFGFFFAEKNSVKHKHGSLQFIENWKSNNDGGLLKHYNAYFHKNYCYDDLLDLPIIMCNTFIISKYLFEKMMSWMNDYFSEEHMLKREQIIKTYLKNPGLFFYKTQIIDRVINPGHIIEIMTGLFLAFEIKEGATLITDDHYITHEHSYRVY